MSRRETLANRISVNLTLDDLDLLVNALAMYSPGAGLETRRLFALLFSKRTDLKVRLGVLS